MFRHLSRQESPLDPSEVWGRMARGGLRFDRIYPPQVVVGLILWLYRRSRVYRNHRIGIEKHYDVSNEFYELFLDREYMFYTYGDFNRPGETLEEAQENKAAFIARLIDPRPGEIILELGCGWGGMLKKIAGMTNDRENLVGYTLSREQVDSIRERLGLRVEFKDAITCEYPREHFDAIYSIGIMEHVRNHQLERFSRTLRDALKPGGRIVHHFFCKSTPGTVPTILPGFEVFPGSELAALEEHLRVFDRAGFRIVHHSIHDYRPTLEAWFDRLAENRRRAIELVGVRTYNLYLAYLANAWRVFDDRDLLPMRIALRKA
ncbi:class I SAM-dependent methyltransferase [Tautonia sp. JC769]|uniref:class I SAM-dependent methyltransferase n=1 Tax=Tautonia sp. JC769 TaxID=3232135 RepID=UPI00345AB584